MELDSYEIFLAVHHLSTGKERSREGQRMTILLSMNEKWPLSVKETFFPKWYAQRDEIELTFLGFPNRLDIILN